MLQKQLATRITYMPQFKHRGQIRNRVAGTNPNQLSGSILARRPATCQAAASFSSAGFLVSIALTSTLRLNSALVRRRACVSVAAAKQLRDEGATTEARQRLALAAWAAAHSDLIRYNLRSQPTSNWRGKCVLGSDSVPPRYSPRNFLAEFCGSLRPFPVLAAGDLLFRAVDGR